MILCIYGPPGSGKSTTVANVGGFDLEDWPQHLRLEKLEAELKRGTPLLGMAGVQLSDAKAVIARLGNTIQDVQHWLLLPNREEYDRRRAERDAARPWKAHQKDYYDGFARNKDNWDRVVDSVSETDLWI